MDNNQLTSRGFKAVCRERMVDALRVNAWMTVREWAAYLSDFEREQAAIEAGCSEQMVKDIIRELRKDDEFRAVGWKLKVIRPADNAGGRIVRYEHGLIETDKELDQSHITEIKQIRGWLNKMVTQRRGVADAEAETNPVASARATAKGDLLEEGLITAVTAYLELMLDEAANGGVLETNGV